MKPGPKEEAPCVEAASLLVERRRLDGGGVDGGERLATGDQVHSKRTGIRL